jgi:hypothetical protein
MERNITKRTFFHQSNIKTLLKESVGIDTLRNWLSLLLFEHVRQELPKLRQDLENAVQLKALLIVVMSRGSRFMTVKDPGLNGLLRISYIVPKFRHNIIRRGRGPLVFN